MKEGRKPEYQEKTPGDELQLYLLFYLGVPRLGHIFLCYQLFCNCTLIQCYVLKRRAMCYCFWSTALYFNPNRLVGLVVMASASRAEDPGFESRLRQDFFGVKSYQLLKKKNGTPVTSLPGARHCTVNTGIGRPAVSIL